MKKLALFVALVFMITIPLGCTAEWYKHDTVYKTNDHMFFSWWGYNSPDDQDLSQSQEEGWWGDEVPYIPGE